MTWLHAHRVNSTKLSSFMLARLCLYEFSLSLLWTHWKPKFASLPVFPTGLLEYLSWLNLAFQWEKMLAYTKCLKGVGGQQAHTKWFVCVEVAFAFHQPYSLRASALWYIFAWTLSACIEPLQRPAPAIWVDNLMIQAHIRPHKRSHTLENRSGYS